MNFKRIAILDLGTNTFQLLITDINSEGYKILHRENFAVRLGQDGIGRKKITDNAWKRGLSAIKAIQKKINIYGVDYVKSIATSAIRNAVNGQRFVNEIKFNTGFDISIIDGEKEAEYIYNGIRQSIQIGKQTVLVMDIGGGSVEFIIGNQYAIFWKKSFEIGAQRLFDRFHRHDPVSIKDLADLYQYLNQILQPLLQSLTSYKPTILIGSSGTFETLSDIYNKKYNIKTNVNSTQWPIDIEAFLKIHHEIVMKDRKERLAIPGMDPMRADLMSMSSSIIHFLLSTYPLKHIRFSSYSLKEGFLYSILNDKEQTKLSV